MEFGLANKTGPSSLLPAYGNIYGYERTSFKAEVELRLPWVTTYESPYRTDGSDTTHKHLMFTASMGNGSRSSGFYMKRGYWVDPHPTFEANDQGLLYQRLKLRAREHTETNSNLSRAPIVIFMG